MNDVERDLRELFDRKAGSVGGVAPRLPDRVRKRSRRRELGTALVSGLTVLALVVGSVAVVRSLDVGGDDRTAVDDPWAGYQVFERTASVGNFTITSPSDWYLVNQWPWARTEETRLKLRAGGWLTPILLLSDTDRGLESSPCLESSFPIRPGDAVMTLAFDNAHFAANFGAGDRAQWPVSFDSSSDPERPPCGPGTYVYFAAGDIPYVAHFAFGNAVTDQKRQTLIDAFEGMQVDDSQEAFMEEPSADDEATYVIAGGENAAGPWTLQLRPQTQPGYLTNVQLELITAEGPGVVAGGPFAVSDERAIEQAGGDPVFGAVVQEATGVELRLEDGTPPIPAQLVPLPPGMPFDFDLFFASNDADVQATAIALGVESGSNVATASEGPTRQILDRSKTWTLVFESGGGAPDQIWFEEEGVDRFGPLPVRRIHPGQLGRWQVSGPDGRLLLFGTVDSTADRLRFVTDLGDEFEADPIPLVVDGIAAYAIRYPGTTAGEGQLRPGGILEAIGPDGQVLATRRIHN
jgi:hypothetical protein